MKLSLILTILLTAAVALGQPAVTKPFLDSAVQRLERIKSLKAEYTVIETVGMLKNRNDKKPRVESAGNVVLFAGKKVRCSNLFPFYDDSESTWNKFGVSFGTDGQEARNCTWLTAEDGSPTNIPQATIGTANDSSTSAISTVIFPLSFHLSSISRNYAKYAIDKFLQRSKSDVATQSVYRYSHFEYGVITDIVAILDIQRDYAPIRFRFFENNEMTSHIEVEESKRHDDTWIPTRWAISNYNRKTGAFESTTVVNVNRLEANTDSSDWEFLPRFTPGTEVSDHRISTTFRVAPDGQLEFLYGDEAYKSTWFKRNAIWLFCLGGATVLGIMAITMRRWTRKNRCLD